MLRTLRVSGYLALWLIIQELTNLPNQELSRAICRWKRQSDLCGSSSSFFETVDLSITISPVREDSREQLAEGAMQVIIQACRGLRGKTVGQTLEVSLKLILAKRSGFLCRRDILQQRMCHSEISESMIAFPTKDAFYPAVSQGTVTSLVELLHSCPGAVLLKAEAEPLDAQSSQKLDQDLQRRLSFNWILPERPASRRMAMIGGRAMFDARKLSFCSQGPLQAAEALGIQVAVVDRTGHWLQDEAYSHLREEFIAIDMSTNDTLSSRICDALRGKKLDGIITFVDEYLEATAEAAQFLGLPGDPLSAYLLSTDKFATRRLADTYCPAQTFYLESSQQLDTMASLRLESLGFPLVVKPCRGGGSRGVSKVNNVAELRQAVGFVTESGYANRGIVIETYANGPEVDANFALWDGDILFFEISDDFPAIADQENATASADFNDPQTVYPSRLDPAEQDMVRSQLHQLLLKMGFRSGIFHVEARVQQSSMRFAERHGTVDLDHIDSHKRSQDGRTPEMFLVEVNARPPGPDCVLATAFTYGVDYNALQWLRGLDDGERFRTLCSPYTCGAQYHCSVMSIPIHRHNVFVPQDFCEQVLQRMADAARHVARSECFVPGKTVSPVGNAGFLAYFIVYSRKTRREVLETCEGIIKCSRSILDSALM